MRCSDSQPLALLAVACPFNSALCVKVTKFKFKMYIGKIRKRETISKWWLLTRIFTYCFAGVFLGFFLISNIKEITINCYAEVIFTLAFFGALNGIIESIWDIPLYYQSGVISAAIVTTAMLIVGYTCGLN